MPRYFYFSRRFVSFIFYFYEIFLFFFLFYSAMVLYSRRGEKFYDKLSICDIPVTVLVHSAARCYAPLSDDRSKRLGNYFTGLHVASLFHPRGNHPTSVTDITKYSVANGKANLFFRVIGLSS